MAFTYPQIIELAKRSGLPYTVVSTLRPGARTLSGEVSWHASGRAVDFGGFSQDALAAYFIGMPTLEVIHHSNRTGKNYASRNGQEYDLTQHPALLNQHRNHLHVAMSEDQVANVGKSGSLVGSGIDLLKSLPNPFSTAGDLAAVLRPIGVAGSNVINPNFWARIGMGLVGASLIVVGLLYINRRPIGEAFGAVTGAVGNVASTAVQGAAFGAGAGATGGLGGVAARQASGPPRRPKAPPAIAPSTAVPVTSASVTRSPTSLSPGAKRVDELLGTPFPPVTRSRRVTAKAPRPASKLPTSAGAKSTRKSGMFKGEQS